MKKILSVLALSFVIFSFILFPSTETEAKTQDIQGSIQKFITDFRGLDFLKICQNYKCDSKNTEWLRLGYEDDWLLATRSNDSQDYLDSCILYKIDKKEIKQIKPSTLPASLIEEWGISKNTSFLELKKIYSQSNNPASYLSDFDYMAKHPRYIRTVVNDVMLNSGEIDILQKKGTSDLYLLSCKVYALPDLMTNFQGE